MTWQLKHSTHLRQGPAARPLYRASGAPAVIVCNLDTQRPFCPEYRYKNGPIDRNQQVGAALTKATAPSSNLPRLPSLSKVGHLHLPILFPQGGRQVWLFHVSVTTRATQQRNRWLEAIIVLGRVFVLEFLKLSVTPSVAPRNSAKSNRAEKLRKNRLRRVDGAAGFSLI